VLSLRSAKRVKPWCAAVAVLILAACGGSDDPPTATTGDFTFSLTPTALTVAQGQSGQVTAALTRTGGFTGAVAGTVEGVPAGVTLTPLAIAAGSSSAPITVTVGAAVAAGVYPITVRANATGIAQKTLTVTLTVTAVATPTVAVSVNPATLSIQAGAQSVSQTTITRGGGFAGAVTLNVTGAPAGVVVLSPAIAVGATTSTITVQVGSAVVSGAYPLTVRANGTGVTEATTALSLTVAANPGSFTLSANPAAVTITQAQTVQTTVSIARVAPHVAPVTLSITGLPTGVSFLLNPVNPVAGTTTTITFTATAGATLGAGTASITGTGGGVTSPAITVPITVQASGGGGSGNVTYNFCALSGIPLFFAYQDGLGAWTRATANASNTYNFTINSPRGGVAYVMGTGSSSDLDVRYGSVAELNAIGSDDCDGTPASGRTINGSVTGIGVNDFVFISGGGETTFAALGFPTFALQNVKPGPFDLIAAQFPDMGAGKFIIRRNLNPPNATALPVLNFAGPEAFNQIPSTVTINNALGQDLSLVGLYVLQGSEAGVPYFVEGGGSPNPVRTWFGVPADKQGAGDLHFIVATATKSDSIETRRSGRVFRNATNQTFTMPAVLSSTGVSTLPAAGGNSRLRAVYTPQVDYPSQWSVDYTQPGNGGVSVSITVSAAYTGGGTVTLDVPDLTPLAGWNTNWGLKPGFLTNWDYSGIGASASFTATSSGLVEGAAFRAAQRKGTITP